MARPEGGVAIVVRRLADMMVFLERLVRYRAVMLTPT